MKFIEGDASFMSLVAIALVLGLAFCIERIIYLSLAETNTKKLMANIEAALEKVMLKLLKLVCRNTRGPVASICYQGLMRIDEGIRCSRTFSSFLWWCSSWLSWKRMFLDYIVYRNGSIFRILGYCNRYGYGI